MPYILDNARSGLGGSGASTQLVPNESVVHSYYDHEQLFPLMCFPVTESIKSNLACNQISLGYKNLGQIVQREPLRAR